MKLYTKLLFLSSLFCLGACSWLDIEPEGEATSDKLFSTGDGIRSVISGVYKAMTSKNLYGVELQFGLIDCVSQQYTWDWNHSSTDTKNKYREAKAFNYQYADLRKSIDAIWADGYNVIANANNLIQNLQNTSPDVFAGGEMERNMILGEAYACRGLMHFDLCRMFAPAPVMNETGLYLPYVDSYPNIQPVGIEVKQFLEKVVADLEEGRRLTADFDLSPLGQSMSSSYRSRYEGQLDYGMEGYQQENTIDDFYKGRGFRLSYYAITAILARVYQYMGNDDKAYEYADQLLTFQATTIDGNKNNMYEEEYWWDVQNDKIEERKHLKMPSNLIFALYNEDAYEDYGLDSYFKKKVDDNNVGQWFVIDLSGQGFFKNPETGEDEREADPRGNFLLFTPDYNSFSEGHDFISAKGYSSETSSIRQDNVKILPVIRTTEMRYIKAEVLAKRGQFDKAYEILNKIRQNRNIWDPALQQQNTMEKFLRDMVNDAQREYLSEGQLFYLYKRLNYDVQIGNTKRKMTKTEYMFPLPDNQNM